MLSYIKTPEDIDNPMRSLLKAKDVKELSPTYIMADGFDPLCDDSELYANCLKDQGFRSCTTAMSHLFMLSCA